MITWKSFYLNKYLIGACAECDQKWEDLSTPIVYIILYLYKNKVWKANSVMLMKFNLVGLAFAASRHIDGMNGIVNVNEAKQLNVSSRFIQNAKSPIHVIFFFPYWTHQVANRVSSLQGIEHLNEYRTTSKTR